MFKPFRGLTSLQIKRIQGVYPLLKHAQHLTGVPWQALAGIWYRESFSIAPPKTPGGPWQFDPVPNNSVLKKLLTLFTKMDEPTKEKMLQQGVQQFESGAIFAACFLQNKVRGQLSIDADDAMIQDALWAYNGRAYGKATNSPYVMNGYDTSHFPMRLVGTIPNGKGGRIKVDILDYRPGAFTIYKQLKTIFP